MKGVHIINDETQDKRYLQIELDILAKARQSGKSIASFLEDLEDIINVELSSSEKGKPWKEVKKEFFQTSENDLISRATASLDSVKQGKTRSISDFKEDVELWKKRKSTL